jgi:hypothetical protein
VLRVRRDRPALVFLALFALGALLLGGVLLAVFVAGGGEQASPTTTVTTTSTPTTIPSSSSPPPTSTPTPTPTTTSAPTPPTTAPQSQTGPLRAIAVGPFSATVEWAAANPPARIGYGLPELGPTMWARVTARRATLTGLRLATTYRVWAGDATLDVATQSPPASPTAGIGGGAILLDGQPFFPLLVLAQCPSGYEPTLAAGITLYVENPCGGIAAQTEALAGRALSLTSADEAGLGGAGVIGWYYPDEADLKGMTGASLPQFPTLAATARLRVLTLTSHFQAGSALLPGGRGVYPGLIAQADVVGFDLYPLQEYCSAARLAEVASAQRELVALAGGRPTFQWIEASTWKCHGAAIRVTSATVRAESWLAVVGGARGLGYFPAGWDAAVTPGIAAVSKEIAALGAALLVPDAHASASGPVVATARDVNGAAYVFAVNPTRSTVHATLSASGIAGRALSVVGESRTVRAEGDSFADDFGPLAVHLYVAAP